MNRFAIGAGFVAAFVLAACATSAPESDPVIDGAASVQSARNGLPPQTLNKDECGLFLWSQADISKFIFFARAGENTALFFMEDAPVELSQISAAGDIFGQFFTRSKYQTMSGRNIDLSFEPGKELVDGARISSGSIQFANAEGWRTVLPVLGARVCQPYAANEEIGFPEALAE